VIVILMNNRTQGEAADVPGHGQRYRYAAWLYLDGDEAAALDDRPALAPFTVTLADGEQDGDPG
jgi:hypothetical protein